MKTEPQEGKNKAFLTMFWVQRFWLQGIEATRVAPSNQQTFECSIFFLEQRVLCGTGKGLWLLPAHCQSWLALETWACSQAGCTLPSHALGGQAGGKGGLKPFCSPEEERKICLTWEVTQNFLPASIAE